MAHYSSRSSTVASILLLIIEIFTGQIGVLCQEEVDGVKLPSKCEACKFLTIELSDRFGETGKTHGVIEGSSGVVKKYKESELRFLETLEGVCDRILSYNMHKEHENSARFAKGMSNTMKALHGLRDKGVKVDLGIPGELWDSPSVEVTRMKQQCEYILSEYEDDLEDWYLASPKGTIIKRFKFKPLKSHLNASVNQLRESLQKFLCIDRVLKKIDQNCLWDENEKETEGEIESESKLKGDKAEL